MGFHVSLGACRLLKGAGFRGLGLRREACSKGGGVNLTIPNNPKPKTLNRKP